MRENRPRAIIRTYPRLPFVQLITGSWFGKLLMIIEYVDFNQAKYVSQLITLLNHECLFDCSLYRSYSHD